MRGFRAALALALLLSATPALAHEVGLSRGDYLLDGATVRADVIFARKELISLVATLDADHDGVLTTAEIDAARDAIQGALVGRIKVKGDGAPCAGTLDRAELAEQDGVAVRALYRCARRPGEVAVELTFFDDLAFGHRHLARANGAEGPRDLVLSQRAPSFSFTAPPAPTGAGDTPAPAATSPIRLGALHVATAWELPVFLVGLLARCAGRRPAALAAALFAVAVALGLVVSALGVFTPSAPAIAAAIALSLVYVGLDNFARRPLRPEARPWIALPFGLVHGLGCGVVAPAGALVPFSLGVAGALAVLVAILVAGMLRLRAWPGFPARASVALSAAVTAAGLIGLGLRFY